MDEVLVPTLFDYLLSDTINTDECITIEQAEKLFAFFQTNPLFKWHDVHNNCEARADAVCLALDAWHIPNYKAWVFSGAFLRNHIGGLNQFWNYHVAALLPVKEQGNVVFYVIDPATSKQLQTIFDWAAAVTAYPHSYHLIKFADQYIFPAGKIKKDNWHKRDKQNGKWMLQGLAGINAVSPVGKARLCFNKQRIKATGEKLKLLKATNPFFAH
jgi:Glutaminase